MNMQPQVGVITIVVNKNTKKILFGRRLKPIGYNMWGLPGGHLEMYETFEECAARETLEESGMIIKNIQFLTARNNVYPEHNKHYITIVMIAEYTSGIPYVPDSEKDKCEGWRWFDIDEIPEPLFETHALFSDINFLTKVWIYMNSISSNATDKFTETKHKYTVKEATNMFFKQLRLMRQVP